MQTTKTTNQKGFTLVELSIVLVIIGLIVGGVLVGQDLINAARIRAQVSQIEKLDAGTGAFQAKYNGKPGDLLAAKATAFGLDAGGATNGNGDGRLDGDGAGNADNTFALEVRDFWLHLTNAKLIAGTAGTIAAPELDLGKGLIGLATLEGRLNYILSVTATTPATTSDILSPAEAYGIDCKSDDCNPDSGIARGFDTVASFVSTTDYTGAFADIATGGGTTDCGVAGTPNTYNLSTESGVCGIAVTSSAF